MNSKFEDEIQIDHNSTSQSNSADIQTNKGKSVESINSCDLTIITQFNSCYGDKQRKGNEKDKTINNMENIEINNDVTVTFFNDLPQLTKNMATLPIAKKKNEDNGIHKIDSNENESEEVGFQISLLEAPNQSEDNIKSDDQSELDLNNSNLGCSEGIGSRPDSASSLNKGNRSLPIEATKDIFNEEEKLAYVGLCKVLLTQLAGKYPFKFKEFASANASFTAFAKKVMKKLFLHMQINDEEQLMINKLSSHGVIPSDLSKTILNGRVIKEATIYPLNTDGSADKKNNNDQIIKIDIRWTILLDLFLLLTNEDIYDSRSRQLLKAMCEELNLNWDDMVALEKRIAEQYQIDEVAEAPTHRHETKARKKKHLKQRLLLIGVATVGGSVIIGLSAGLLAPVIGIGVGTAFTGLGLVGTSSFFTGVGGTALIATGGVVAGGTIAGQKMEKRTRGVSIFEFLPVHDHKRASVLLSVTGWLPGKGEDVSKPFAMVDSKMGDHFSLLWEPEALKQLGNSLKLLAGEVLSFAAQEILKHTLLSALLAALAVPMALSKLGYLVDNPWSNGLGLAEKTGLVLADTLLNHAQGHRPVSLVGFSLGARVIYYALLELARVKAYGIVENVYIFGAPVTASQRQWREAASVVSGRFVNGHVKSDWILGFLYRAASTSFTIAGLNPVSDVEGLENLDVTDIVSGHLAYRHMMPTLMKTVGIPVTKESFEDDDDEEGSASELEVSDNLEAIMKGNGIVNGTTTSQNAHIQLKPKKATRAKTWYDTSLFNKLRWTGKAKPDAAPSAKMTNLSMVETRSSTSNNDSSTNNNNNINNNEDPYSLNLKIYPTTLKKAHSNPLELSNHQRINNNLSKIEMDSKILDNEISKPSTLSNIKNNRMKNSHSLETLKFYPIDSNDKSEDNKDLLDGFDNLKKPDISLPKVRR